MAGSKPVVQLVHGEPVATRPTRVLLGWLTDAEAAQQLLGRGPENETESADTAQQLAAARARVLARPPVAVRDPIAPRTNDIDAKLKLIAQRTDMQAAFASFVWRTEVVDLRSVLSFQKLVATDTLEERIASSNTTEGLFELCLPTAPVLPPLGVITDPSGKGFTISALNPNLRHAGSHLSQAMVSPAPNMAAVPMQAITLFVNMGTSFLQVARYKDRCFLRDGYHRAAGLIRAGINVVPCAFIEARSFEELACPPGALTYEVMYGDRPPALTDFWDEGVSRTGRQLAVRKVVRVTVEEFIVPR